MSSNHSDHDKSGAEDDDDLPPLILSQAIEEVKKQYSMGDDLPIDAAREAREKVPDRADGFILNEDLDEEEKDLLVQSNLVQYSSGSESERETDRKVPDENIPSYNDLEELD